MLQFNLSRITKLKGIARPFSYFINLGYSQSIASKMAQGTMQSFTLTKLEQYCIHLNCTPNDLFEYSPNPKNPLPESHALNALIRHDNAEEIISLLHNLPVEKIRELANLLKNEGEK